MLDIYLPTPAPMNPQTKIPMLVEQIHHGRSCLVDVDALSILGGCLVLRYL
jgi:hypothetical protein